MSTKIRTRTMTISICVDCLFALANGAENVDQQIALSHMEKIWGDNEITLGSTHKNCNHSEEEWEECEQLGFSWYPCNGCNSQLGGDRFAATVWF